MLGYDIGRVQGLGLHYPPILENHMERTWKIKWKLGKHRDLLNLNSVTMVGNPCYLLYRFVYPLW